MKTENLANKYRPTTLKQVVGQPLAIKALTSCLERPSPPSAILISGPSGCGKTTLAQIYGRMLNCATHDLCGTCFSCKLSPHPDVIFHDCAINGKADDIRGLVAASKAAPMTHKRVIVADEIHALRDQSERMLLLVTENPAPNTVWICCTTNPEQLSKIFVSRLTHIRLEPVDEKTIVQRLSTIYKKETGNIATKEVKQDLLGIAQSSMGSVRQAISELEVYLLSGEYNREPGDESRKSIEHYAAELLAAVAGWKINAAVTAIIESGNARQLLSKTRWVVHAVLCKKLGIPVYQPYGAVLFYKTGVKCSTALLSLLQRLLCEVEHQMNTNMDDTVSFYSMVAEFIVKNQGE